MIHVVKDFNAPPLALSSQDVATAIEKLILNNDRKAIISDLYRGKVEVQPGQFRYEVVEALMAIYHDKCAYCESKEFDPQVEHYRPKNKVVRAARHPGYYWLAFEWSNLVSTCFDCNKVGTGKGNRFPLLAGEAFRVKIAPIIAGNRFDPGQTSANGATLLAEKPSLLHPEIDNPETCFLFDNKGAMKGVDADGRGETTIKVCNLNRKNLLFRRQEKLDEIVWAINRSFQRFITTQNLDELEFWTFDAFTRLKERGNPEKEFSLFLKQAYQNFEQIMLPLFDVSIRPPLLALFERFKLNN
jgi:uncharacterized protein (TIGR02646 family)